MLGIGYGVLASSVIKGGHPVSPTVYSTAQINTSYVVPAGVTIITVEMWAGGGGGTTSGTINGNGGGCGYVMADIPVTPGETLTLSVGAGGMAGNPVGISGGAPGGGNGGSGSIVGHGGGGGGYSVLKRSTTILLIAGGGGGCGEGTPSTGSNFSVIIGGAGGGTSGMDSAATGIGVITAAKGGSQIAGGAGAISTNNLNGNMGSSLQGGAGVNGLTNAGGGGGGGGYFGGGGGCGAAGGAGTDCTGGAGGSGYYDPALTTAQTLTAGSGRTPAGTGSPKYAGNAGLGGTSSGVDGNPGLIIIY